MHKLLLTTALPLFFSFITISDAEACEFEISRFQNEDSVLSNVYDVFGGTSVTMRLAIDVHRLDDATLSSGGDTLGGLVDGTPDSSSQPTMAVVSPIQDCIPSISFAHEGRLTNLGSELGFSLYTENSRSRSTRRMITLIEDAFDFGETRRITVDAVFAADQFVPSGLFSGDVVAHVHSATQLTPDIAQSVSEQSHINSDRLGISVQVPSAARVLIAGTRGKTQTVDFGVLTADESPTRSVGIIVQSTASYRLHTRSENGGRLLRNGVEREHAISYQTTIANQIVNLNNNVATSDLHRNTTALGDALNIQFRIISSKNKPAGNYSDTISVSVMPDISGS